MTTTKRTVTKKRAVAAKASAPVITKRRSESHIPTASVMWIAVLAIVFSFTGITLSAMAKATPVNKITQERFDIKSEVQGIVNRLDRIEKKIDTMNTSASSTN